MAGRSGQRSSHLTRALPDGVNLFAWTICVCKLRFDDRGRDSQIFVQDCPRRCPKTVARDVLLGVVAHASMPVANF